MIKRRNQRMSIKFRLILVACTTTASLFLLLVMGNFSIHTILALENDVIQAADIRTEMLLLRRYEKDFIARKDLKYQKGFNETLQRTFIEIDALKTDLLNHGIDRDLLVQSEDQLQKYGDKINKLVELQTQIGLHSKDGYYNILRTAVHDLETQIKLLNDYQLQVSMLQLRRDEKDFMLRRDSQYSDALNKNLIFLFKQIANSPYSDTQKTNLTQALDTYKTNFNQLVNLEKEMGLDEESGLQGELRDIIHTTEKLLAKTTKSVSDAALDKTKTTDTLFISISALFAVLNITLIFLIVAGIIQSLETLSKAMGLASIEKDLTHQVEIKGKDEIANIANIFNGMLGEFRNLMIQVKDTSALLSSSAEQMKTNTDHTSQGIIRQRTEIEVVATAINEMSNTSQEVAQNANNAANASNTADEQANKGNQIVVNTINAINLLADQVIGTTLMIKELDNESNNISTVINVIRQIAEQTNLLALNAAIEAARAGVQGRGFAVVADEVRTLAQRCQEATQEINEIITNLQVKSSFAASAMENGLKQTQTSVKMAKQAGTALTEITTAVTAISAMNMHIATSAEEQTAVAKEINRNVLNISHVADETAKAAQETTDTSHVLAEMAKNLRSMISQFKC